MKTSNINPNAAEMIEYLQKRFTGLEVVKIFSNAVLFYSNEQPTAYLNKSYIKNGTYYLESAAGEYSVIIEENIIL